MNKIKIDNYYKPESKTLRLDEVDYTIIPNSDIKPLLDKLQQENKKLNSAIQTYDILLKSNVEENKQLQERMEYLERSNNRREDIIIEQRQEINNLEDKWDELKEIIRKKQDYYKYFKDNRYRKFLSELLNKMQELERGVSDVED